MSGEEGVAERGVGVGMGVEGWSSPVHGTAVPDIVKPGERERDGGRRREGGELFPVLVAVNPSF